jgi:hypothetical protein
MTEITTIPVEILFEIFLLLDVGDMSRFARTCKDMLAVWNTNVLWKNLLQRDTMLGYGVLKLTRRRFNLMETYKELYKKYVKKCGMIECIEKIYKYAPQWYRLEINNDGFYGFPRGPIVASQHPGTFKWDTIDINKEKISDLLNLGFYLFKREETSILAVNFNGTRQWTDMKSFMWEL